MPKTLVTINVVADVPENQLAELLVNVDASIRDSVNGVLRDFRERLPANTYVDLEGSLDSMIEYYGTCVLPIKELPYDRPSEEHP